jgi:hypothetical protein
LCNKYIMKTFKLELININLLCFYISSDLFHTIDKHIQHTYFALKTQYEYEIITSYILNVDLLLLLSTGPSAFAPDAPQP